MSKRFRPNSPFDVALKLLVPVETKVKGGTKKTFPDPSKVDSVFFGSFKTFGGTEHFSNDVFTIYNTATIECWYNPAIKADCEIYVCETGEIYQIISEPENINMRHQFMQFKVEKVGGKA